MRPASATVAPARRPARRSATTSAADPGDQPGGDRPLTREPRLDGLACDGTDHRRDARRHDARAGQRQGRGRGLQVVATRRLSGNSEPVCSATSRARRSRRRADRLRATRQRRSTGPDGPDDDTGSHSTTPCSAPTRRRGSKRAVMAGSSRSRLRNRGRATSADLLGCRRGRGVRAVGTGGLGGAVLAPLDEQPDRRCR